MTGGIAAPYFPADLGAWQKWQSQQRRAARVVGSIRRRVGSGSRAQRFFLTGDAHPDILVAFDTVNPSTVRTLAETIDSLRAAGSSVSVIDGGDNSLRDTIPGATRVAEPKSVRAGSVIALGHFLPVGGAVWRTTRRYGGKYHVLQHGLLTPFAPPLPSGAHLLAWSDNDGRFWTSDRLDVTTATVGSASLARSRAESQPVESVTQTRPPLFLGQMHGVELSWKTKLRSTLEFCVRHSAVYRPHPSEESTSARAAHTALRAAGVPIDHSGRSLAYWNGPVVSMFSTGLLEAAAASKLSYGTAHNPPPWLLEFWDRYSIGTWPTSPTQVGDAIAPKDPRSVIEAIVSEVERR